MGLLIRCVVNGYNGVLLGANGLADWSGQTTGPAILVLIAGSVGLRAASRFARLAYGGQRGLLLGAFGMNLLLFVGLGGLWGNTLTCPEPPAFALASRRAAMRVDTIIAPGVQPGPAAVPTTAPAPAATDGQTGKRLTYVLLAVLGIGLGGFSMLLACDIACSGYGFLAAMTLLLGTGAMAASVYLLARLREQPIRPLHELPRTERRPILGRFWKAWLLLAGVFALLVLVLQDKTIAEAWRLRWGRPDN